MSELFVVATPIGNLQDITLRAIEVLKNCDAVICEDTRITARLLEKYEIKNKKLLTYNDNSDDFARNKILHELQKGLNLALVSDAGTPLISDPGYKLIKFLRAFNIKITPIPGVSSVTAALSASGISCDNFLFIGFLPTSSTQRKNHFKDLPQNFTFVFFESANRIEETLEDLFEICGNRKIAIARELTKMHEEIINDDLKNLLSFFKDNPDKLRGEFVVIVEKISRGENKISEEELIEQIKKSFSAKMGIKEIAQNLAEIHGLHKKHVYQLALRVLGDDV